MTATYLDGLKVRISQKDQESAPVFTPPVFSVVRVARSLVLCVCFVDCLSFCTFSFGRHCVVCSSLIYGFGLPLWYLQTHSYYMYFIWESTLPLFCTCLAYYSTCSIIRGKIQLQKSVFSLTLQLPTLFVSAYPKVVKFRQTRMQNHVSVLASSVVDFGFDSWSGKTHDYKIGTSICCL